MLPVPGSNVTEDGPSCRPAHAGHGWVAAVVPADAKRFRVEDPALAATLGHAGAELVDEEPDVEIVRRSRIRGDSPVAVVDLGSTPDERHGRLTRIAERLAIAGRVRLAAPTARARLRRAGYDLEPTVHWDVAQSLRLGESDSSSPRLVERLARRGLVVGRRGARSTTMLEAVVAEAGRAVGSDFERAVPGVREGLLVVVSPEAVLRLAVGPARAELATMRDVLGALRAADPPAAVAERVPWTVAYGRTGLVDWLVERRLPGAQAAAGLDERLVADCVEFLVGLHAAGANGGSWSPVPDAEIVARFVPSAARALIGLANEIADDLSGVPCGFAHGDFWSGNLLVEHGRLTGVVDWDAAAAARPALLDLLHLRVLDATSPNALAWGNAVAGQLLPWAQSGGDQVSRDYCRRIGIEPTAKQLRALAIGYWLQRLAYQLGHYANRGPRWIDANVGVVLAQLRA